MVQTRHHFHQQMQAIESVVLRMASASSELFRRALAATKSQDVANCDSIIAGDDEVDAFYMEIERGVSELLALQGPVASDLRFLAALLHINLHLERIADMAVNVAKLTKAAAALPSNRPVLEQLHEMGAIALNMLSVAMDSFARRDVSLARQLPSMDDPLDELNRGMLAEVLLDSDHKLMLEWGIHMHLVSRQIERVGDNAVDIGEQVAYLVSGQMEEFTDASHPEVEAATRMTGAGP